MAISNAITDDGEPQPLPAPSVPIRARTPSETSSTALAANSPGICAW